jgi:nanoRNase/pAp phosphatase (c-di-AMP/oligoRNAs hydrolase)
MSETDKIVDFTQSAVELVETIKKYPRLLTYIKGSPDPDALGGYYVLKLLCTLYGTAGTIASPREASLPQNIKRIKDLRLPAWFDMQGDHNSFLRRLFFMFKVVLYFFLKLIFAF